MRNIADFLRVNRRDTLMRLIAAAAAAQSTDLTHSPVRTPGGHSGPAFSSPYVVACTPSFSTSYCNTVYILPMSFPMRQRRGYTNARLVLTYADSRTELLTPPITKVDLQTAYCTVSLSSPPVSHQRGGTNSYSQTLARKKIAPRKAEPPLTPFDSNPTFTHCKI